MKIFNYKSAAAKSMVVLLPVLAACEKTDRSFSILATNDSFKQTVTYTPRPIDILWIVDDSGSMRPSQESLTENFPRFINRFEEKNYDFHMAVQTTEAWLGKFQGDDSRRRFRTGFDIGLGTHVMSSITQPLADIFTDIAMQGTSGSGDERAFSSFLDTLDYAGNSDFRRADAFLSIIIVSDEDDFSATNAAWGNDDYSNPNLIAVSHYKDFLDQYAGSGNYNVNAIAIIDQACRNTFPANGAQKIGTRYLDLINQVNSSIADPKSHGQATSLCENFGNSLELISNAIASSVARFKLNRIPLVETISVKINGASIPQSLTNGWHYDVARNEIALSGTAEPGEGDVIDINYDPAGLGQ